MESGVMLTCRSSARKHEGTRVRGRVLHLVMVVARSFTAGLHLRTVDSAPTKPMFKLRQKRAIERNPLTHDPIHVPRGARQPRRCRAQEPYILAGEQDNCEPTTNIRRRGTCTGQQQNAMTVAGRVSLDILRRNKYKRTGRLWLVMKLFDCVSKACLAACPLS